jgi:hypothetical protein
VAVIPFSAIHAHNTQPYCVLRWSAPPAQQIAVRRASRDIKPRVDRQSWPKAAWWLRGGVRMASRCSDAPLKKPLIPLHVFIKAVGPLPPLQALNTYVMRLREHGWNVWKPIQKALQCGAHMDATVARVVRLSV